jgi:peptidoglycan/LPS O-acetylase OafA/YrhL
MDDTGRYQPIKTSSYRPEVQGLRAVASLLVATYHIWLGRVSGGVDIFFVVSSFLVTTTLLKQVDRNGRVSFIAFWAGLAQRLLPAAMLTLTTVALASLIWLPRTLWEESLKQIVASALYLENWQLAFDSVDYLSQGQSATPVQHYWAMSTQGQFYLIWPCIMVMSLAIAKGLNKSFRYVAAMLFATLFLLSLAYSIVATARNQPFAYFNTFARMWEFCSGATLALLLPSTAGLSKGVRVAFGWGGLIGMISCGMLFQVSRMFPGYAALWPVCCGLMIIVAGTSGSRFGADRLLSWQPLVYLGGISYAIYLWHWPILIFFRWLAGHVDVGLFEGLGIITLSIALAAGTTRFIENPLRTLKLDLRTRARLAIFTASCLAPVAIACAAWGGFYVHQKAFDARPIASDDPDYPGALARTQGFRYMGKSDVPLYPGMLAIQNDLAPLYADGCYRPDPDWQRANCLYGDRNAKRTLTLVGGSHSAHWLPALDILAKQHGWRVTVLSKNRCVFSAQMDRIDQDEYCQQFNQRTLQILLEDRPEVIFTTSTRGSGDDEHIPEGFMHNWKQLTAVGIKVIAVRDTPWMQFWIPECMEMHGFNAPDCVQSRERMLSLVDPAARIGKLPENVALIDMTEFFCDARHCPPVAGNLVIYRDDSHITTAYSRSLVPALEEKLKNSLPEGWIEKRQTTSHLPKDG